MFIFVELIKLRFGETINNRKKLKMSLTDEAPRKPI